MSELEPDDSRDVTGSTHRAPGEPPRTGPREDEARARAQAEQGEVPARRQGQRADNDGFATEGDSPEHPDRFGDSVAEAKQQEEQQSSGKGDRWSQQSDREDYVPEGK